MTDLDLDAIKARATAATPAPWLPDVTDSEELRSWVDRQPGSDGAVA